MSRDYKAAYGIDRTGTQMVLARVAHRGAAPVVESFPVDSEAARESLARVEREVKSGLAALSASAPAPLTLVRRLRAPFASTAKAAKVWPSLLDVELPFPVEGSRCAYGRPWVADGGTLTVAAAIRNSDLSGFDDLCRAQGFNPTHVDSEVLAIWDQLAVESPPARSGLSRLLVWLGEDHAVLVRGRGGEFMAAHVLRASPCDGNNRISSSFETLWAARLAQVLATQAAETESNEIDIWWAGPVARGEEQIRRLRQALPGGRTLRHETVRQPDALLARGLARRVVEGSGMNFKTGEDAHPARLKVEARAERASTWALASAAILVLVLNLAQGAWRHQRDAVLQERVSAAARSIAGPGVPRGQESLMVQRALSRRDEETQPFRRALDVEGMERTLESVLREAAELHIEISRLTLSAGALMLEGSAAGIQAAEALSDRLREQGWTIQTDATGLTSEGRPRFILKGAAHHEA